MSKNNGKKSLSELAMEVAELYENDDGKSEINEKTIRRRFAHLLKNCGGDIRKLQDDKGRVYFPEEETAYVKYLLLQLAEKDSFIYRTSIKEEFVTLDELHDFIQDLIYHLEAEGYEEDEVKAFVRYFDIQIGYTERCLVYKCHQYVDCIAENYNQFPYTLKIHQLSKFHKKLENENIWSMIQCVKDSIKLMELMNFAQEYGDNNEFEDEDDIDQEYLKRDRELVKYLNENPLIKQHVEKVTEKKVDVIFEKALLWLKENGGKADV